MISDAVRVARIERDRAIAEALVRELGDFARNPVVELVGGYVAVEALQRGDRPVLGEVSATACETALTLAVVLQALGSAAQVAAPALNLLPGVKALLPG